MLGILCENTNGGL